MSVTRRRNEDKRTPEPTVISNILSTLARTKPEDNSGHGLASLGEIGFPDYSFGSRQGAALAVCRIVKKMEIAGLVRYRPAWDGYGRYFITTKGRKAAKEQA